MKSVLAMCLPSACLLFVGCAMCASPHDCTYNAFGGRRARTDMAQGRVGSSIDPAMEESFLPLVQDGSSLPTPVDPDFGEPLPAASEETAEPDWSATRDQGQSEPVSPMDDFSPDDPVPSLPDLGPGLDREADLPNLDEVNIEKTRDNSNPLDSASKIQGELDDVLSRELSR